MARTITVSSKAPRKKLNVKKADQLPPLTHNQEMAIRMIPHQSMHDIIDGKGTATDWFNVAFRVVTAREIARMHYSAQTVKEVEEAVEAVLRVYHACKGTTVWKFFNREDKELVSATLRATDTMQDTESRETMIYTFKKAKAWLLKNIEEKVTK